jgi:hypothetical protein
MRSFIAYLLLFAIMLPTLSPWGTVAYFNINRNYIAKVLCENRDRPQLNCNGKCYLAKKLKQQQDKKDKETTERVSNSPVAHLFCLSLSHFLFTPDCFIQTIKPAFGYLVRIYSSLISGILRPPQ